MRIPFKPLSLLVIAIENKIAGAPLPKIPTCKMVKYLSRGTVRKALTANGSDTRQDIEMRRLANSSGVNAISPFFISM